MKGVISLIVVAAMLLVGCQDDSSPISPQAENDVISLDKISLHKGGDKVDNSHFVYNLGDIKDYKVKASKNFKIDGKKGGKISLEISWNYNKNEKVELKAELDIPKKAYDGKLEFDMIFNLQDYNLELYPSPFSFDKPVKLDLKFRNVDLFEFVDADLEFNYIDDTTENIKYKSNKIDFEKQTLEVKDAELHHFSRYGWTRKKNNDDDGK